MTSLFVALPLAIPALAHADYVRPKIEHVHYGDVNVVVPVTSSDTSVWSFKLRNAMTGVKDVRDWGGSMAIRFVLYGPGVKMLMHPDDATRSVIDQLRTDGVKFEVCNNTLMGMNLDWHELYNVQETDIVQSGFVEVGWLANKGWAVHPMK